METIGDAKDVAKLTRPLTLTIPSKQGVVLMSRDSPSGTTHSQFKMPLCPAYRFCRQSKRPYRPMLDSDHDQQVSQIQKSDLIKKRIFCFPLQYNFIVCFILMQ